MPWWAMRVAVKLTIFGVGLVGMLAYLMGKDQDSPQAQMFAAARNPQAVCSLTPMPRAQCECIVAATSDKPPVEMLDIMTMDNNDPAKAQALEPILAKCRDQFVKQ